MPNLVDEIKGEADCIAIFRRFWPTNYRETGNFLCPFHADKSPSLQASRELVYCHACGVKHDAIDLYAAGAAVSTKEAIQNLATEFGLNIQEKPLSRPSHSVQNSFKKTWDWLMGTTPTGAARAYLEKERAIPAALLEELRKKYSLGFTPTRKAWAFPVLDWRQKELLGIQYIPYVRGETKKFATGTKSKDGFFRHGSGDFQVVTEAVIDALSVKAACKNIDIEVISLFSCSTWRKIEQVTGTPVIFMDRDFAGDKTTIDILLTFTTKVRLVDWSMAPDGNKDVNDLLQRGHHDIIERMVRSSKSPRDGTEARKFAQDILERMALYEKKPEQEEQYRSLLKKIADSPKAGSELPRDENSARHLTDLGNAERFVEQHKDSIRFCPQWGKWLHWSGKCWEVDDVRTITELAKTTVRSIYAEATGAIDDKARMAIFKHARSSEAAKNIRALISLAESDPRIVVKADSLDSNAWLLNVINGTLDLKTGDLLPHNQENLITKMAPVVYDPKAGCPQWLLFLDRIMDGSTGLLAYLQLAFGYTLTGDTREKCMIICHGLGDNGKTVFTSTLSDLMGDYARETPVETLMVKRSEGIPNDVARLKGARFVTASEGERGQRLAESLVKRLTGGDKISARFLHHEWFEFVPNFKLIMSTNHKPQIRGNDKGIWSRIHLVPFSVSIPKEEQIPRTIFCEQLRAEFPGILAWGVKGCIDWQIRGLKKPEEILEAVDSYRSEMDILGPFFEDRCVLNPLAKVKSKELYEAYVAWCSENKEEPISKRALAMVLQEKGHQQIKIGQGKDRGWKGLGIRNLDYTNNNDYHNYNARGGDAGTQRDAIYGKSLHEKKTIILDKPENTSGCVPCVPPFDCSSCGDFSPSSVNKNGFGVCRGIPLDGKFPKHPHDGEGCQNHTRKRASK